MKFKVLLGLLIISIGFNVFMIGHKYLLEKPYEPTEKERIILSEMIPKTIKSEDYKKIAEKEKVIAIESSLDKNKGGVYPYYMEVSVRTDKQTYLFSCSDDSCSDMENEGWTYSNYQDEKPYLPLKK